jgi:hypothetical protein
MNDRAGNAFLLPGQGSQYVGMGSDLVEGLCDVQRIYERADELLDLPLSEIGAAKGGRSGRTLAGGVLGVSHRRRHLVRRCTAYRPPPWGAYGRGGTGAVGHDVRRDRAGSGPRGRCVSSDGRHGSPGELQRPWPGGDQRRSRGRRGRRRDAPRRGRSARHSAERQRRVPLSSHGGRTAGAGGDARRYGDRRSFKSRNWASRASWRSVPARC